MQDYETARHRSTESRRGVREFIEISEFLAFGIPLLEFQPSTRDRGQGQSQCLGGDQDVLQPIARLALCAAPGNFSGGAHELSW